MTDGCGRRYEEEVLSRWPEIFVGCLAFVLIVIGIVTWRCCVRRKRRMAKKAASMGLATGGPGEPGPQYKVIEGSASAMDLQEMGNKQNYDDDPYAYRGHKDTV